MESTIAEVVSESPMTQEEAKNDAAVIAADDGNMENGKNPVLVAVVAAAEVASIISPAKTVESPQEIKNMKNEKKKKQKKEVQVSNTKKPFIFYLNRAKVNKKKNIVSILGLIISWSRSSRFLCFHSFLCFLASVPKWVLVFFPFPGAKIGFVFSFFISWDL